MTAVSECVVSKQVCAHLFERMAREMMEIYPGLRSWWQWPWEAAVKGGVLQGFLGPVFLVLPLSILALRYKLGRLLIVTGLMFAIPIIGNMGTRFILPALPFFSLALGLVLSRWPAALYLVIVFHALTALPPVARQYAAQGALMLDGFPIREALRIRPEEDTLHALAASYDVASMIEKHVSPNDTVLALAWVMEAYTTPTIRTHHLSASNERLAETLWTPVTPRVTTWAAACIPISSGSCKSPPSSPGSERTRRKRRAKGCPRVYSESASNPSR